MPRIIALLLLIRLAATATLAADHISDQHRFTISLPDTESWMRGNVQPLGRDAEIVFSFVNMESREGVTVAMLPKIPTNNIMNQAVISRIIELLTLQGFTVLSHAPRTVNGLEHLEFVGRRTDENGKKIISISRGLLRDGTVYLTTFFGVGDEDRALDASFLRVINTFRLLDDRKAVATPEIDPMFSLYRPSYIACLSAAGVLALLFAIIMFRTRKRMFE